MGLSTINLRNMFGKDVLESDRKAHMDIARMKQLNEIQTKYPKVFEAINKILIKRNEKEGATYTFQDINYNFQKQSNDTTVVIMFDGDDLPYRIDIVTGKISKDSVLGSY